MTSSETTSYVILNKSKSALEVAVELQKLMVRSKYSFMSQDGGGVDYSKLRQSDLFMDFLSKTRELRTIDLRPLTCNERKAFFINIYNALTIHALAVQPELPGSVLEVMDFWKTSAYIIAGHPYSLDDIEHGILRNNKPHPSTKTCQFLDDDPRLAFAVDPVDARIHFALNCGAQSCPPINVYTEKNLERALDMASRNYLSQELEVDVDGKQIKLPSILKWYGSDAAEDEIGVVRWTLSFIDEQRAKEIEDLLLAGKTGSEVTVAYKPYKWNLNSVDVSDSTPGAEQRT